MLCYLLLGMLFLKAIECQNYKPLNNIPRTNTNQNENYTIFDFNKMGRKNPLDNRNRRQTILPRISKSAFSKDAGVSRLQVDNESYQIKPFLKEFLLEI